MIGLPSPRLRICSSNSTSIQSEWYWRSMIFCLYLRYTKTALLNNDNFVALRATFQFTQSSKSWPSSPAIIKIQTRATTSCCLGHLLVCRSHPDQSTSIPHVSLEDWTTGQSLHFSSSTSTCTYHSLRPRSFHFPPIRLAKGWHTGPEPQPTDTDRYR